MSQFDEVYDNAQKRLAGQLAGTKKSFDNQCDNVRQVLGNIASESLIRHAPLYIRELSENPMEGTP